MPSHRRSIVSFVLLLALNAFSFAAGAGDTSVNALAGLSGRFYIFADKVDCSLHVHDQLRAQPQDVIVMVSVPVKKLAGHGQGEASASKHNCIIDADILARSEKFSSTLYYTPSGQSRHGFGDQLTSMQNALDSMRACLILSSDKVLTNTSQPADHPNCKLD